MGRQCFWERLIFHPPVRLFFCSLSTLFSLVHPSSLIFHLLAASLPFSFSLFLAPQALLTVYPTHWVGEQGGVGGGAQMDDRERFREERVISLALALCDCCVLNFCTRTHLTLTMQVNFHKQFNGNCMLIPAHSAWFKLQRGGFSKVQSFITSLYLFRRE